MLRTIVLSALFGTVLQAQQPPLVGTWRITYTAGLRMENGPAR